MRRRVRIRPLCEGKMERKGINSGPLPSPRYDMSDTKSSSDFLEDYTTFSLWHRILFASPNILLVLNFLCFIIIYLLILPAYWESRLFVLLRASIHLCNRIMNLASRGWINTFICFLLESRSLLCKASWSKP